MKYGMEEARAEAFDLLEDFLDGKHFATGQDAHDLALEALMEGHMMPLDKAQAAEWVKQYFEEHLDMVDLSLFKKGEEDA